ncbi:sensor domain-containing diguanylate cyclase [Methylotetracoccus oryzae]|uniref:sensor domain-containing diguanylate cyclase n=1 Tax=Methylotetracoccus oryzae TaxID=1919059 RepID=UPI001119D0F6|nr:diguanylate cyclase [Methylotetracoccus oryzae]
MLASQPSRPPAPEHRRLAPLAGLNYGLVGLLVTAAFCAWNSWTNRTIYLEEFAANARERAEQVKTLYLVELTRQQGVGALFAASGVIDAEEFRNFVRQTEAGTATARLSMALLQRVSPAERKSFERALRKDYGAANTHFSASTEPVRIAQNATAPYQLAIRYAEPVRTELSAPGLDLSSDPSATAAAQRAAASGRTTFADVPHEAGGHAFRLLTPIYRSGLPPVTPETRVGLLAGFICGTYRYRDLFEAVFSRSSHLGQHVYAFDTDRADARAVYVHESRKASEVRVEPKLRRAELAQFQHRVEEQIALADHSVTLTFVPIRSMTLLAFLDDRGKLIALGGLLVSGLLAFMGYRIATARAQREASEERLRLAATVFHDAQEAIVITDASGNIIDVNGTFSQITGYPRDEVLGKNPRMLKSGVHDAAFYREFWQTLVNEGVWRGEIWNRHRSGDLVAVQATVSAVRDESGRISHFIDLFSDVTDRKTQQERIEHLAYFDALTDLPNRALLLDRLEQALARGRRDDSLVSVAYLDLDDFKPVNDTHGHKAGDLLLCEVARRLKASVREHDTVCRLGGDEFVIILAGLRGWEECEKILSRTLESVSRPYALPNGQTVLVSGSIGVTLSPPDRSTADILLRHADQAMYIAKRTGRNRMHRFAAPTPPTPISAAGGAG